jgi:hypothetical protein
LRRLFKLVNKLLFAAAAIFVRLAGAAAAVAMTVTMAVALLVRGAAGFLAFFLFDGLAAIFAAALGIFTAHTKTSFPG